MTTVTSKIERPAIGLIAALALFALHLAPWAAHHSAALTQSAHDLAISTRFTPGAGQFRAELFLLPAWCAGWILAALAGAAIGGPRRMLLMLLSTGCIAYTLPEYPRYLQPEFRAQTVLAVLAGVLALIAFWLSSRALPARMLLLANLAIGLMLAVPLFGLWWVRQPLTALLGSPVVPGWGWWGTVTFAGIAMSVAFIRLLKFNTSTANLG